MSRRMTTSQKIEAAKTRSIEATLCLLRTAEQWDNRKTGYELDRQRLELFEVARKYSRSLDALTRVRS